MSELSVYCNAEIANRIRTVAGLFSEARMSGRSRKIGNRLLTPVIYSGSSRFAAGLSSRAKIMKCVTSSSGTNNVGMYQAAPRFGATST